MLWHKEPQEGPWRMGVSVLNENQQQVAGLDEKDFQVLLDGSPIPVDNEDVFKVQQNKRAFAEQTTGDDETRDQRTTGGLDPVNYDFYIAIDLTASMGESLQIEGQEATRTRLSWVAHGLAELFKSNALFDKKDLVYISGFTSQLETQFMMGSTNDRKALRKGLTRVLEFTPQGTDAALFASMLHNLSNIRAQAARYNNQNEDREAVLVVLSDSFNGMDLAGKKRVSRCADNEELAQSLSETIRSVSDATGDNLKVYILAMGTVGEAGRYTLDGPLNSRCSIRTVQKDVVDARSFEALKTALRSGQGDFIDDPNPFRLLGRMKSQFENLRRAYEVQYPAHTSRPRTFGVRVRVGEDHCEDAMEEAYGFLRQVPATTNRHSPGEVALLLASLIISLFFLPRSLVNLSSGVGSSAPKRRRRKKSKRRRKKP
ncbi:MAG TPA: hypothetical protein DIU15_10280 [Deltaproteobacteria bacterium]|nr:hypothetical protein [Deltaproteobacteria bacterium]